MIRSATLLAAVALLAACSTPPKQDVVLSGDSAERRVIAVATLSTNDCEAQTASTYTAAIMSVRVAAAAVRKGTLDVERAKAIQALGESAKANLDASCVGGTLNAGAFADAQREVESMQTILGGAL